jgi:hypothetical protein
MHVFLKEMGISGDARVAILEHTPTTAYNHYEIKDVVDLHIDFQTLYHEGEDTVEDLADVDDVENQEREKSGHFQFSPDTSPEKHPGNQSSTQTIVASTTAANSAWLASSSTDGVAGVDEEEEVEEAEGMAAVAEEEEVEETEEMAGDSEAEEVEVEETPVRARTSLRSPRRPLSSPPKEPVDGETGGAWKPYKSLSPHKGNTDAFTNFVDDWKNTRS